MSNFKWKTTRMHLLQISKFEWSSNAQWEKCLIFCRKRADFGVKGHDNWDHSTSSKRGRLERFTTCCLRQIMYIIKWFKRPFLEEVAWSRLLCSIGRIVKKWYFKFIVHELKREFTIKFKYLLTKSISGKIKFQIVPDGFSLSNWFSQVIGYE